MTSKKELQNALTRANAARAELRSKADALYAEVAAHRSRESRELRRRHEEDQAKRRVAEAKARKEKLDHLRAGRLPLKSATQWAIVHEEGSKPGIEVFVPLDSEEQKAVQSFLDKGEPANGEVLNGAFDVSDWQRRIWESHANRIDPKTHIFPSFQPGLSIHRY